MAYEQNNDKKKSGTDDSGLTPVDKARQLGSASAVKTFKDIDINTLLDGLKPTALPVSPSPAVNGRSAFENAVMGTSPTSAENIAKKVNAQELAASYARVGDPTSPGYKTNAEIEKEKALADREDWRAMLSRAYDADRKAQAYAQETEEEKAANKARQRIALLSDAISGFANLFGTIKGGVNMTSPGTLKYVNDEIRKDEALRNSRMTQLYKNADDLYNRAIQLRRSNVYEQNAGTREEDLWRKKTADANRHSDNVAKTELGRDRLEWDKSKTAGNIEQKELDRQSREKVAATRVAGTASNTDKSIASRERLAKQAAEEKARAAEKKERDKAIETIGNDYLLMRNLIDDVARKYPDAKASIANLRGVDGARLIADRYPDVAEIHGIKRARVGTQPAKKTVKGWGTSKKTVKGF